MACGFCLYSLMKRFFVLASITILLLLLPIFYAVITPCISQRGSDFESIFILLILFILLFWINRAYKSSLLLKRVLISFMTILISLIISFIFINSCYFPKSLLQPQYKLIKINEKIEIVPAPPAKAFWCF